MAGNADNQTNEQNSPAAASCGNTAVQGRGIFLTAESVDNQNIMQIPFIAPNIDIITLEGDEIVAATNKDCSIPVGFRFAPTDAELIENYLMNKVNNKRLPPNDNIHEANLYETEPAQLTQQYKRSNGGNEWFFFTSRNRKYPNGVKPNRATGDGVGYWKVTGDDKPVVRSGHAEIIGYKRNLDFFEGRYPSGERSKWKMHEYRVKDGGIESGLKCQKFDSWVMCKIYVTRNRKDGTSQAVAGASSMAGHSPQPSIMWNNNTVDATRFTLQNPDVSSSQQDYNGMSLMEAANDDKRAKELAPQSSWGIRPTYVSHEQYSSASFSELDTNGASSMPGSSKKRVGEPSSMAENRNRMHASQNPLMPDVPSRRIWTASSRQDVNGASPMAGSDWQAINGAPSMSGKNNTPYASQNPLMEAVSAFLQIQDASTQAVNIDTASQNPNQYQYTDASAFEQDFNGFSAMGNSLQNPEQAVNIIPFVVGNDQFPNALAPQYHRTFQNDFYGAFSMDGFNEYQDNLHYPEPVFDTDNAGMDFGSSENNNFLQVQNPNVTSFEPTVYNGAMNNEVSLMEAGNNSNVVFENHSSIATQTHNDVQRLIAAPPFQPTVSDRALNNEVYSNVAVEDPNSFSTQPEDDNDKKDQKNKNAAQQEDDNDEEEEEEEEDTQPTVGRKFEDLDWYLDPSFFD
ncbi:hypothetical protein V6N13_085644 [Hibiscus sabdariffa]|uniref:NAC domain-containing protein n=2 Tax=Hibiscus sabdariffa TaxID=183260 RepID=A0ABR2D276_9ROSI